MFINADMEMKCEESGEHARCRNSGLAEDLGKVCSVSAILPMFLVFS